MHEQITCLSFLMGTIFFVAFWSFKQGIRCRNEPYLSCLNYPPANLIGLMMGLWDDGPKKLLSRSSSLPRDILLTFLSVSVACI